MAPTREQTAAEHAPSKGPFTGPAAAAPAVRQPGGNAAAQDRLGQSVPAAGFLGDDASEVLGWMWDGLLGALGFDTGETEDGAALAKQTADNLKGAHKALKTLAEQARLLGFGDVADRLQGAAAQLADTAGLGAELSTLLKQADRVALVERLLDTTSAVLAVDMRSPEAAATFDDWFSAVGETGAALADAGGAWGAVLKPFATFIQMLGDAGFFAAMRKKMGMHGADRINGAILDELDAEGT